MSNVVNVTFKDGETWTIDAVMNDSEGNPLNLAGGQVKWRVAQDGELVTELSIGNGITLVNGGAEGECLIVLTPAQQTSLDIEQGLYRHEAQVILADGTVSDQFDGYVQVTGSLF